jgi:hypothetical protein
MRTEKYWERGIHNVRIFDGKIRYYTQKIKKLYNKLNNFLHVWQSLPGSNSVTETKAQHLQSAFNIDIDIDVIYSSILSHK